MKRFTETEKWKDGWFRKLPPISKVAFEYIRDNCDAAGVWDPDFELADFSIGEKVNWKSVQDAMGDRVQILPCGKWHLTRFVYFQNGELTEQCRPHVKILMLLKGHGIPYPKGIQRVSKGSKRGEERIKEDRGGVGEMAELIYSEYPRKEAKQAALIAICKALDHGDVKARFAYLIERTRLYALATMNWTAEDRQFIPHPATWFNRGSFDDDQSTWIRTNGRHAPVKIAIWGETP